MALPRDYPPTLDDGMPATKTKSGIIVQVVPGDPRFGAEIQRSTATGTTGVELTVALWDVLPASGKAYLDILPLDGVLRSYRGRATGLGYEASSWTEWTTGHTPVVHPRAVEVAAIQPGALTPGTVEKTYVVSYADFIVSASTPMAAYWSNSSGHLLWTVSSGQSVIVYAPIHPPIGVQWSTEQFGIGATLYLPGSTWAGAQPEVTISLHHAKSTAPATWIEVGSGAAKSVLMAAPTSEGRWLEPSDLAVPGQWAIEPGYDPTTADSWAIGVAFAGVSSSAGYGFGVARAWVKYKMPTYDATR